MKNDVECPYCGAGLEICHDDGYGYDEDTLHEQQCDECDKTFTYRTSITYYYEAFEAPCLNGEPHSFKRVPTAPVECTKMRCQTCEQTRKPADDEWKQIYEEVKKQS